MKPHLFFLTILLLVGFVFNANSQSTVFSHLDSIVEYDDQNPPTQPIWGQPGKWVRTDRLSWDTDSYKCYIYKGMAFRLKYPKNFNPLATTKYPMIVMMHGRGERGDIYDNEWSMKHGGKQHRDAIDNEKFDGFMMYPQNTTGFFGTPHFDNVSELINDFFTDIHVDLNRVSVHGLSAGASASWNMILRHPKTFASALPMSGASINFIPDLYKVQYDQVWQFQGGKDVAPSPSTTQQLMDACWNLGMDVTYTVYPDKGHGVWNTAYKESDFFPFITRANKTNPLVYFEQTEFCPNETIFALLGVTDSFPAYEWRKDGVIISGADSNTYPATTLGTYDCRFKRDSIWSQWSEIPVVIQMKDSTPSPTIEVIGKNSRVFPAPDSLGQVTLGVPVEFHEYVWKYKDSTAILDTNAEYVATEIGKYVVYVKEKFGCQSSQSFPFEVIDANGVNLPDAPLSFTYDSIGETAIRLAWIDKPNPSFNETGYEIYRSETSGGPYSFMALTNADEEVYNDLELESDHTYYYIMRSVNDDGASAITSEISVTTESDDIRPTAPLNLDVIKTSPTEITLTWDAATDNVGIDKYDVYSGGIKVAVTSDTVATVYNLTHKDIYNFTVRARDFAGNESPHSSRLITAAVQSGLNFSYYHGTWTSLPDFPSETPIFSGISDNVDISIRTQDNYFGFMWEGYIDIPVAGNYTFETYSDDGSKLYIGAFDEDSLLVDNDGLHGSRYRDGTKHFGTPGTYKIFATFFERSGGQQMKLFWKNTAHGVTSRVQIPDSAFSETVVIPSGTPDSASHLYANTTGYSTIGLTWQDNSSNETGFQIYRMEKSEGFYRPVVKVGKNTTTWTDTGLPGSTTYTYRIVTLGAYTQSVAVEMEVESQGHWGFNNNGNDDSGNNNSTFYLTGPTFVTDTMEGSHVLEFDGVDDIISFGPNDRTTIFQKAFTTRSYSFWMKLDNPSLSQIIYEEGGKQYGIAIAIQGGHIHCVAKSGSQLNDIKTPFTSTDWTHITFTIDGYEMRLYVNGEQKDFTDQLPTYGIASRGTGAFGGLSGNGSAMAGVSRNLDGRIDDFYIMEYSMNTTDIYDLMNRIILDRSTETTWPVPDPPRAPESLVVSALTSSEIFMTWADSSTNEENFVVYRSANDSNHFFPLAVLPINSSQYTDTGLYSSGIFFYRIESENVGGSNSSDIQWDTTFNNPPIIDAIADFAMHYNTTKNIQIFAQDLDFDAITLSAANLPSFATFTDYGDGNGLLSLSPLIADTIVHTNIIVKATDYYGDTDSTVFNLTVDDNYLPTLNAIANIVVDEGDSLGVEMVGYDSNGVATMNWSGVDLPGFVTIVPDTDGTALLRLQPEYYDGGYYAPVSVKVTDNKSAEVERIFSITVNEVNPNQTLKVNMQHSAAASSPWNNVQAVAQTAALTNTDGDTSLIKMELLTPIWTTNNKTLQTGDNSGIVPDDVLKAFFLFGIWGRPDTVSMKLTGLNPNRKFDLSLIGNTRWNYENSRSHTIYWAGSTIDSVKIRNNFTSSADLKALVPDSTGTLIVNMTTGADAQGGYLNGFILEDIYHYDSVPASPRSVTAAFANYSVNLSWYDAPFNETGYDVYRSEVQGGPYVLLTSTSLAANSSSYNDASISAMKTYYYVVQAVNDVGVSPNSNEASVNVPNMPPTIMVTGNLDIKVNPSGEIWNVQTSDSPNSIISLSVNDLPSFATFSDSGNGNGSISFTPGIPDIGTYIFSIEAEDNDFDVRTEYYTINILENVEPVLYSMKINFSNYNNAASPWNNTNAIPSLNDTLAGLVNDSGNATAAALTFETLFGGSSQLGGQTGDNSGIVPDAVLKEYYWFGFWGAAETQQLKLIGLDYTKKYNIHFIGSSTFSVGGITDNGSTNYNIGNRSVSMNVQNNTANEVVMKNVVANNLGEIIIDLEKGANATMGVINAIIIDVLDGNAEVFEPNGLAATAVSSSQIDLCWNDNSYDETNYVIYRSLTSLPGDFVAVDTVAANVSDYSDMGVSNGPIYYYKVRGLKIADTTNYSNVARSGTISYSVYINLNGTSTNDEAVPWNNLSSTPEDGTTYIGFKNASGNSSGISMEWVDAMSESNDWGTSTTNNSGVYPDKVLKSFFLMDGYEEPAKVAFSGLSQEYDYHISFLGSISTGYNINTSFSIGDVTVTNHQSYNTSEVVTIYNVVPDINNEINFEVKEVSGSKWGIFNAVVIEAVKARVFSSAKSGGGTDPPDPDAIAVEFGLVAPEIEIYPNPIIYNDFNLRYKNAPAGEVEVTIIDITGRIAKTIQLTNFDEEGEFNINLGNSNLHGGMYIVTAEFYDGRVSQAKLIKQ